METSDTWRLGFNLQADRSKMAWVEAFEDWLDSKTSQNTRLAYSSAWRSLIEHTQKMPWEIERGDLLAWVVEMGLRGFSRKTIQLRLGAISSYYRRGLYKSGIIAQNPASRIAIPAMESRRHLTAEQIETFLQAIPRHTLNGKRDYALFLCYASTGCRNSQVRCLQIKDILIASPIDKDPHPPAHIRFPSHSVPCATRLWQALQSYLCAWPGDPQPESYLFTAWRSGRPSGKPLAMVTLCKLARRYARLAGLGSWVTVECLRRAHEGSA
jgi:integrase